MGAADTSRILIVGPAWVGDMIMAQSLFKFLKRRHPDARIDVAAPPLTLPLIEFMPEVQSAIEMPFRHGELDIFGRYALGNQLKASHYDVAYVLPRTLKAALIPYWARILRRIGHPRGRSYGILTERRTIDPAAIRHQAARFVALAAGGESISEADVPRPRLDVSARRIEAALDAVGRARPSRPLTVLAPGSGNAPSKRWSTLHFAELARTRYAAGREVWLIGSTGDAEITADVQEQSGGVAVDLGGRTSLGDAVALTALADEVVSNDTGTLHIAAALGRKTVGVFGPTDPDFTLPMTPNALAVRLGLECSPCHEAACPLGHHKCMRELAPSVVLAGLDELEGKTSTDDVN